MNQSVRRPLLVLGAGGLGRETAQAALAVAAAGGSWRLLGHLDDDPAKANRLVDGVPVLGPIFAVADHPGVAVVVATGRPTDFDSRRRLVRSLALPADRYATVVHPGAHLADSVTVGVGCVLLAGVVATAAVRIGDHVAVMPQVVLTHDDVIGDFATLAAGVLVAGGVTVGAGAYLGAGSRIREGLVIGEGALIGMGSVVTRDVPAGETWWGVPARSRNSRRTGVAS